MEFASARALLAGVVDYAGLFPPAALSMADAVAEYDAAQRGPHQWMLGRFVVPATRLTELALARIDTGRVSHPWSVSAIVRDASDADRSAIATFNAETARHNGCVDAIECKPSTLEGIDWLADSFSGGIDVYVEVSASDDAPRWLERVAARGLRAKVRAGGVTAEAFPAPEALVTFLEAAVRLGLPFKATAGLHHAVRGDYPLTYEPGAARSTMHGYLNVLLATAALYDGRPAARALDVLRQTDAASLHAADDSIRWSSLHLSTETLRRTREQHLVSFGSCSFREPADESQALHVQRR